jgi:hypothetical protein
VLKYPWVARPADDLSDRVVITAADWAELGHASVSLAHSAVASQLGLPRQGRAISSLLTGVSQLRTRIM